MQYKQVDLKNREAKCQVGIVKPDSISTFLANVQVKDFSLSKQDYETFLAEQLVPTYTEMQSQIELPVEQRMLLTDIVEQVYRVNPKLHPKHVVVQQNRLYHISDAMRENLQIFPTLPTNPGWLRSSGIENMLDPRPLEKLVKQLWETARSNYPIQYAMYHLDELGVDVPVMDVTSAGLTTAQLLEEFVTLRCGGDLGVAQHFAMGWAAHVLGVAIPRAEDVIEALENGNYTEVYTHDVVITQLYKAVLAINADLDWQTLDWSLVGDEGTGQGIPLLHRTPASTTVVKTSKEEVEAERKLFQDTDLEMIVKLPELMKQHIVGQDEAIDALGDAIAVARMGLRGPDKPIGTFLMAGKTGTGKTETAVVLADLLASGTLVRIDCSEYKQAHEISKLFGAPPGYLGHEDYGRHMGPNYKPPETLALKIKKNPFCVLLFDEIEKAHEDIYDVMLQIMDAARITSGRGEVISFENVLIMMTSNIGAKEAEEAGRRTRLGFGESEEDPVDQETKIIMDQINDRFKPEFRNRLSRTILYRQLTPEHCHGIVDLLLAKTNTNLEKAQHLSMQWDEPTKARLVSLGFSKDYGARHLKRTVEKEIELPLAKFLLASYLNKEPIRPGSRVKIETKEDEIQFRIEVREGQEEQNEKDIIGPGGVLDSGPNGTENQDHTQNNEA
jgi:hypothetical protein